MEKNGVESFSSGRWEFLDMRMWMVPTSILCKQHLLGEHLETHMFVGSINKQLKMDGYVKNNCLEIKSLLKRHDDLAIELERRGMKHNSPLPVIKDITYLKEEIIMYTIDKDKSLKELLNRCTQCKERFNYEN